MKNYEIEAKERFGGTVQYREYEEKTADYTEDKWQQVNNGLMTVIAEFAKCMQSGYAADSTEAQALVAKLQNYITDNYYTCTKEIIICLGQMYVADERFRENIDKHTPGTAEFASKAIEIYCSK